VIPRTKGIHYWRMGRQKENVLFVLKVSVIDKLSLEAPILLEWRWRWGEYVYEEKISYFI
jgi:hypothetical protein